MVKKFSTEKAFRLYAAAAKYKKKIQEGDIVLINENNKALVYHNDNWEPLKAKAPEDSGVNISLFEYNQQIIAQLDPISPEQLIIAKQTISNYIRETTNHYYMLLNNNQRYYTVFTDLIIDWEKEAEFYTMTDAVITCCQEMGTIKTVDYNKETNAIEIWIEINDETDCYVFFPYDAGIVGVGARGV